MSGAVESDVIVLGAGIAGASVAYILAPQAVVTVLEREAQPGMHATGRSAAMFHASYGSPQVRALTRASRPFFDAPPAGFAQHAILSPRGALVVGTAGQADAVRALHDSIRARSPKVRLLDGAALRAMVPVLEPGFAHTGLHEPDAADIDVNELHQGYLRGFKARGGALHCGVATHSIEWVAGRWVVDAGESFYFKPDAGLLLGSPANADPAPPHDVQPEELDIATGIHRIEQATTLRIRRPTRTWAGLRSFVASGDLAGGFAPGVEGFFWLAAQGGYGIQTSAAMGEACAQLVLGRALPAHLQDAGLSAGRLAPR